MNKKGFLFLLTPLLLVAGCATPYIAPTGEDSASVTFQITQNTSGVYVSTVDSRACDNQQKIAFLSYTKPLLNPEVEPKREVKIRTDKEFLASLQYFVLGTGVQVTCTIGISFLPSKNDAYHVMFDKRDRGCSAQVQKWNSQQQKYELLPSAIDPTLKCTKPY